MINNKNIVLIGMPGCGKTTIGKILAKKTGYTLVDLDKNIEDRFGTIHDLFEKGEDYFRECETKCAIDASKTTGLIIATGGGIVTRKENIDALSSNGTIFFLNRSVKNIIKDIVCDTRPLLSEGKKKLYDLYNQRISFYNKYSDVVIDSNKTIDEVINDIQDEIKEN